VSCMDCLILHNILKTTLEFTNTIQNCGANCEKLFVVLQNPVAHCWSEQTHHKRKFCNVCRKRLDDSLSIHCEGKCYLMQRLSS